MANALWGQNGYPWLPAFLGTTKKYYGAGLREVDFIHATEQARKTINAWVEKETRDKIKELLKEGILTSNTKLVLTNAIYFKGDWAAPFDKKKTADGNFFVTANRPVKVPMMYQEGEYRVHRDPAYWALELPYKGKEVSMLVFLPEKPDGLADFEKKFNADFVAACVKQLQPAAGLEVYLPKFKMTSEFSLGPALSDLGMKDAFGAADFSGMDGTGGLSISAVVHKAFVEVNEQGTEAAAATAVILGDSARKPFRADHPFVFVIRDNRTGSILFIGRVTDPSKS